MTVVVIFLVAMTKIPGTTTQVHSLRIQSIMAEQAWWQEPKAAGHSGPTVRKQRGINADVQSLSPYDSVWVPSP